MTATFGNWSYTQVENSFRSALNQNLGFKPTMRILRQYGFRVRDATARAEFRRLQQANPNLKHLTSIKESGIIPRHLYTIKPNLVKNKYKYHIKYYEHNKTLNQTVELNTYVSSNRRLSPAEAQQFGEEQVRRGKGDSPFEVFDFRIHDALFLEGALWE